MTDFLRDPPRWKDRADQARLAERAAGQMVRNLGTAEPLSDVQMARIAARVRAQHSRPHRLRLWVPATAVLLFGGVAAASAAHIDILPRWLIEIVRPGSGTPTPRLQAPRSPRLKPSAPAPAPAPVPALVPAPVPTPALQAPAASIGPAPATEVSPPVQPTVSPRLTTAPRPSPGEHVRETVRRGAYKPSEAKSQPAEAKVLEAKPPQPTNTVLPSMTLPLAGAAQPSARDLPTHPIESVSTTMQLAWVDQHVANRRAEPARTMPVTRSLLPAPASQSPLPAPASPAGGPMKYLSSAVHALRVEHSPTAALALLDRHAGDLEKSSVSHEALLLRVEAMLKLNRQAEVLQLLDTAPLAGVAASRTLLLTRGELRASAGRCADAVMDFDLVLVQTQGRNKRALAGLAKCQKPAEGQAPAGVQESSPR